MKAAIVVLGLLLLACTLGVVSGTRLAAARGPTDGGDFLDRVLGQGRLALSVQFLQRADLYYHGGVESDDECLEHEGGHDDVSEAAEEAHHHDEDVATEATAATDWWSRLNAEVHPHGHEHLRGVRYEKEILPWVWAAVQADPHNTKAYEIGAYWLGKRLSQPDEALRLLRDGQARNPASYALASAVANLYQDVLRKNAEAYAEYLEAERKWRQRKADDNGQDARLAGAWILTRLAILDERAGRLESALARYKEALPLVVDPTVLGKRIATLEAVQPVLDHQPLQPTPSTSANTVPAPEPGVKPAE